MNPPHAGRCTRRVSFYRCIFNSFFFILKNGGALSAAMGAAAKKGVPSSGEKIFVSKN
jgi:hypothetical protein